MARIDHWQAFGGWLASPTLARGQGQPVRLCEAGQGQFRESCMGKLAMSVRRPVIPTDRVVCANPVVEAKLKSGLTCSLMPILPHPARQPIAFMGLTARALHSRGLFQRRLQSDLPVVAWDEADAQRAPA